MTENANAASGSPSEAAQGSAPDNTQGDAGSQVGTAQNQGSQESGNQPSKGVIADLIKHRQGHRQEKERADAYAAELEKFRREFSSFRDEFNQTKKDLVGQGEGLEPQSKMGGLPHSQDVQAHIQAEVAKFHQQLRLESEMQSADSWIRSQEHFKQDPKGLAEVQSIIGSDPVLLDMAQRYPKYAAEEANRRWLHSKGINPGDTSAAASAARAAGFSPSGQGGSGGSAIMSREQASQMIEKHPIGSKERNAAIAEVQKAVREGRIK